MLSDEELKQKVLEAQEELKRAGITIDLEAEELAALPKPEQSPEYENSSAKEPVK